MFFCSLFFVDVCVPCVYFVLIILPNLSSLFLMCFDDYTAIFWVSLFLSRVDPRQTDSYDRSNEFRFLIH